LDFRYIDLKDIDPNFTLLDPEFYNLRITKAEIKTYLIKDGSAAVRKGTANVGDEGTYLNFAFTVVDHQKFTGRKHWESLFPSDFSFKCLKRIEEATGVQQTGSMEDWLSQLTAIGPTVKLKVDKVPDVNRDGTPNQKTMKADGTPGEKNVVDWKAGVAPGDSQ
jgi:hypothetical protein